MVKVYILGLLMKQEMHGYAIQELLKQGNYEAWANINPNTIYSALKTLERNDLVELSQSVAKGNQTKSVYRITKIGESKYHEMLLHSISSNKTRFPSDIYVGISFITDLTEGDALEALNKRINTIEEQLDSWNYGRKIKVANPEAPSLLNGIFQNGIKHLEADHEFLIFLRDNLGQIREEIKRAEKKLGVNNHG